MSVLESKMTVSMEKHFDIHIERDMLHHICIDIFNNSRAHYANCQIGKSDLTFETGNQEVYRFQVKNLWQKVI